MSRDMTQLLRLALLGCLSACITEAGTTTEPHGRGKGFLAASIDAPPAAALADLPLLHGRALSPRMELAFATAERSMDFEMPAPPADPTVDSVGSWLRDDGFEWFFDRYSSDRRAHCDIEAAASDLEEQIVAAAVTGLLFEDQSRETLSIPAPRELVELRERLADAELREMLSDPMMGALAPIGEAAAAYHRCAELAAIGGPAFDDYWFFCEGREANLPARATDELDADPTYEEIANPPPAPEPQDKIVAGR